MTRRAFFQGLAGVVGFFLIGKIFHSWFLKLLKVDTGILDKKYKLIEEIAETILPRSSTPGASDTGVAGFIVEMVKNCFRRKEQLVFISGLNQLERYSERKLSKSFVKCDTQERIAILDYFERRSDSGIAIINKIKRKIFGDSFIVQIKALTVEGYCTSEIGATQGLAYDPIPVEYNGCLPVFPGQRAWATK